MGTDGMAWAKEFMRIYWNTSRVLDEGIMVGWFANAIEAGRTAGRREVCPIGSTSTTASPPP
jgi:hypothetical protein